LNIKNYNKTNTKTEKIQRECIKTQLIAVT